MTFSYQLQNHIPPYPSNVTPPDVSAGYWQANLMCHLLDNYDYQTMLSDKVHVAMLRLVDNALTIPDEISTFGGTNSPELSMRTKVQLIKHAVAVAEIFLKNDVNASFTMGELYWREPDLIVDKDNVILHFEAMNTAIANDMYPPHPNPQGNEYCRLCLTFLPRLKKEEAWPKITETIMADFIRLIKQNSLKDLHTKDLSGDLDVVKAVRLGRDYWILLEPKH